MIAVARTQRPIPHKEQTSPLVANVGLPRSAVYIAAISGTVSSSVTGFYPVRCAQCNRRFYRFRPQFPAAA